MVRRWEREILDQPTIRNPGLKLKTSELETNTLPCYKLPVLFTILNLLVIGGNSSSKEKKKKKIRGLI